MIARCSMDVRLWPLIWTCTKTREQVNRKKKKPVAKRLIMNPSTAQSWMMSDHDDDDEWDRTPRAKRGAMLTTTYSERIRPHRTVEK